MIEVKQVDSLIFDMDGTLWDGVACYTQGFNDYFDANNIEKRFTKQDLYGLMGMEENKYLEIVLPEFPFDERKEMYKDIIELQYENIKSKGGELYPHVKDGLAQLSQHYKMFIVSNCAEFTIKHFTEWAGIEKYIIDSRAHAPDLRPKHENIKSLIDKYSLKNPVYIGDTASDGEQSKLAGVPFVFVNYGFGETNEFAQQFGSFKELTDFFLQ